MADNDNNLVFTVSSDMSAAQRGLNKFVADVGTSTTQIAKKFEAAGSQIDRSTTALQTRINGVIGLGTKATKEWTGALADQGKELERLRSQYNPLFATLNNYKTTVADIRRAHAIGAISANEMAVAISKERQAALASTAAIKGRNAAIAAGVNDNRRSSGGAFQTANIAAQFQDIAVTSAMGMNPLQIALQQGTQLSSVFATMGSGRQVVAGLAAAFTSLVNPVSLVTLGLIAGGAAAIQYFQSVASGGDESAEKIKEQAQLVQNLAERWGDVIPALREYANELARAQDAADIRQAAGVVNEKTLKDVRSDIKDTQASYAAFVADLRAGGEEPEIIKQFEDAYQQFAKAAKEGKLETADVQRVQDALAAALKSTGIPAIAEFKKIFDELSASAKTAAGSVSEVNDAASRDIPMSAWRSFNPQTGKLETNASIGDENIRNPGFMTPEIGPVPGRRPNIELEGLPGAEKLETKAETAAQRAANAYRDLIKSADDRIGQIQQEIELLGKYGVDVDAARLALDLFQQSEDKGRSLSAEQRKEIEKKVELYKQYSETLAKAKLQQDLMQDMRFNSLSKQDQQITTVLRQYGLPEDLNSNEAGMIRQSLNIEDARSELKSFLGDFKDALLNNGGDIGKAFAESISNALLNSASKIWDKWIDQFVNQLISSVTGNASSGGGGSIGSVIGKAIVGEVSGKAPVTPVTRAPLGDIASYISDAAIKRGIDPDIALRVAKSEGGLSSWNMQSNYFKNGVQEPSFGPFQLYKGGGLGNAFMAKTGLDPAYAANGPAGVDFALDYAKKNGWGAWYGAGKAGIGDFEGINASVDKLSKSFDGASEAINVQMGRTTDASAGLGKLANSTGTATDGLGQLGNGLTNFGQKLSTSFFPNAPTGGGGGGWLSSLFGAFVPNGAQATLAANGGIGLYADGGHVSGPGGPTSDDIPAMLSNGEYVINASATRRHRRLLDAINSGSIARFASGGLVRSGSVRAGGAGSGGGVVVNIQNNTSSQIKQQSKETANGTQIDVVIDELVADKMSTPGSRSRVAMSSQFGLKGGLARR